MSKLREQESEMVKIQVDYKSGFLNSTLKIGDSSNGIYKWEKYPDGVDLFRNDRAVIAGDIILGVTFYGEKVERNKGCSSTEFQLHGVGEVKVGSPVIQGQYKLHYISINNEDIGLIKYHKKGFRFRWTHFIEVYSDDEVKIDVALFCFFHIFCNDHAYVGT